MVQMHDARYIIRMGTGGVPSADRLNRVIQAPPAMLKRDAD
jgi:hypothetical protein